MREKIRSRPPIGRNIYLAEKEGQPTRYNLMREAIDKAIAKYQPTGIVDEREHILPGEKAFAYKMKMEAMRHQVADR